MRNGPAGIRRGWHAALGYVRYMMPQSVLNSLSQNGAVLLIGYFAGLHWAGIFWLAFRAIAVPNSLLGKSLRQISLRSLSGTRDSPTRFRFVVLVTGLIGVCYAPVPLFLYFWGEAVFGLVFGETWRAAGVIGFWLSCWLGLSLSNTAAQMMLVHADYKRDLLILECVSVTVRLGALSWALAYWGVVEATAVYALVAALFNAYIIAWGVRVSRNDHPVAKAA